MTDIASNLANTRACERRSQSGRNRNRNPDLMSKRSHRGNSNGDHTRNNDRASQRDRLRDRERICGMGGKAPSSQSSQWQSYPESHQE